MSVPITDSRGLSLSELFVLWRGLAMLHGRVRRQRISHKHMLHLCKATLTVLRLIWKLQIFIGLSGLSEILVHVVFNFLESFIKWSAHCSHCTQEGPVPTKKPCLVFMIWESLSKKNSSWRSNVLLAQSIVVSTALDSCQLLILATASQLDQYRQVPVLPSQAFRGSATTFILAMQYTNVMMTRADELWLVMNFLDSWELFSWSSNSQCVSHFSWTPSQSVLSR